MGNNGVRAAMIAKILLDHGAGVDVADEVRKLIHYDIMSEFCFAMCKIALEPRGYAFSCFFACWRYLSMYKFDEREILIST